MLRRLHCDRGSAAVPFILSLPIFLLILAILVQYALIVNAKIMIDHSAQSAARAAVTSLPENQSDNIKSAACLTLTPLSPVALSGVEDQATSIYNALLTSGVPVADTFPARYTYAMDATTVDYTSPDDPVDYVHARGHQVDVSVTYRFRLTVPAAMRLIGKSDTVAGVEGRFLDIISTSRVETSHSRQAASGDSGWPQ